MKLKVTGDGTERGTNVVDENENNIEGIKDLTWNKKSGTLTMTVTGSIEVFKPTSFRKRAVNKGRK